MPRFIDTNILLYSLSRLDTEARKRDIAIAILDSDDCVMSVQVLQEFYVQATRSTRSDALPHGIAAGLIRTWLRFRIEDNTLGVMQAALDIKAASGFSYWDSVIIAAAQQAGCNELLSEDMSHGRTIAGLRLVNPFL